MIPVARALSEKFMKDSCRSRREAIEASSQIDSKAAEEEARHQIADADRAAQRKIGTATARGEEVSRKAQAELDAQLTEIAARANRERAELERRFAEEGRQFNQNASKSFEDGAAELRGLTATAGLPAAPWAAPGWSSWTTATIVPDIIRVGDLIVHHTATSPLGSVPCLVPFPCGPIVCEVSGNERKAVVAWLTGLLVRFLATVPPGKLEFVFIDPVELGQSVAALMPLADHDDALVRGRAWTEARHIDQKLAEQTEYMETVIRTYLRDRFPSLADYNQQAEVVQGYRVLLVVDYPVNFSEEALQRLVNIAQNGPRCGIVPVIVADVARAAASKKRYYSEIDLGKLAAGGILVARTDEGLVWSDEDIKRFRFELDSSPPASLIRTILESVGRAAKAGKKVEVPFDRRIAEDIGPWWLEKTTNGLSVPLGPASATKLQRLELGEGTAQHVVVAGRTGSGKSTLFHILILGLAIRYAPDELELYLIDFKKGVEFKTYADFQLPHARVIAIESEREFGLSVLQRLDDELSSRAKRFQDARAADLATYRERTNESLPRIVLVVDEFHEFFTEDDTLSSQAALILDRLVKEGRGFGIHVILGSQSLAGRYMLPRSTIDQIAVRIALQCSEADSRLILSEDNPAARLLVRPGHAIYNNKNGLIEGNSSFQVAWLPDTTRSDYLAKLAKFAQSNPSRVRVGRQTVFDGRARAPIQENEDLLRALDIASKGGALAPLAWLGDPVAIRPPVEVRFRRQSGANLLLVGQDDLAALAMMASSMLSLTAHVIGQHDKVWPDALGAFTVLDFGNVDSPYRSYLEDLIALMPVPTRLGRRRALPEVLRLLQKEVKRRFEDENAPRPPIYVILYGLQRARDLRRDAALDFETDSSEASLGELLSTCLRDGPDVGVHTLLWCDTVNNLERSLERRALREFAMRVVTQMSPDDSSSLIDSAAAAKLGLNRAFFHDEEAGETEKIPAVRIAGA